MITGTKNIGKKPPSTDEIRAEGTDNIIDLDESRSLIELSELSQKLFELSGLLQSFNSQQNPAHI